MRAIVRQLKRFILRFIIAADLRNREGFFVDPFRSWDRRKAADRQRRSIDCQFTRDRLVIPANAKRIIAVRQAQFSVCLRIKLLSK